MMLNFFTVPGTKNLFVSEEGIFSTSDAIRMNPPEKCGKVQLELFGELQWIDKNWIVLASLFGMSDKRFIGNAKFYPLTRKRRGAPWHVTVDTPLPIGDGEHRIVPNFPTVAVNNDGTSVICVHTQNKIQVSCMKHPDGKDSYSYVTIPLPGRTRHSFTTVHRLVASAWVENESPETDQIVNHLDGVPSNNRWDNLEWTTYQGNNIHAVTTGLRPTCVKCISRDAKTGDIREYPSLWDASRELGLSRQITSVMVKSRPMRLFNGRYELRMEGDTTPWFHVDGTKAKSVRYVFTVTYPDGNEVPCYGTIDLIQNYKLWNDGTNSAESLMAHLRRKHPKLKVSCVDYGGVSEVQVRNVDTGEVITEPSIRSLCRRFNWHYGSVHPLLKNGENEVKLFKGHQLRFACDDPWPEPKATATADQIVQVTCEKSGIMKEFPSLRTAAAAYSVDRQKLQRMHKKPLDKDSFLVTIIKPG